MTLTQIIVAKLPIRMALPAGFLDWPAILAKDP